MPVIAELVVILSKHNRGAANTRLMYCIAPSQHVWSSRSMVNDYGRVSHKYTPLSPSPSPIALCLPKMDQSFADMLADRSGDPKSTHGKHDGERHGHTRLGAQSVGVELTEGPIDWVKFTTWLKAFLEKEGEELIWRLKGVLWTTAAGGGSGATATRGWSSGRRTVVQVRAKGGGGGALAT